jgi:hypothetical protein
MQIKNNGEDQIPNARLVRKRNLIKPFSRETQSLLTRDNRILIRPLGITASACQEL